MSNTSKPVAWSYSSLNSFENCAWRHYLTKVQKSVVEPQTVQLAEGNAVHKAFELHIKGEQWMPEKYSKYTALAEQVKATPGAKEVERRFALTSSLKETTYFGKDVWLRGQLDLLAKGRTKAVVLDWKTGKRKPDSDQLKLFAAATFALLPHIEQVFTGFVWLPDRRMDTETYEREEAIGIWQEFSGRVRRLEIAHETGKWPKRPSGLCRLYCPVGKNNCEHCGT